MPRVCLDDRQRIKAKNKDFCKWLKGRMAMEDVTQKQLAKEIGITQQALSFRIKNQLSFDYMELLAIFKLLNVEDCEKAKLLSL